MISVEEALGRVLALAEPTAEEQVPVDEAIGRALSADVVARRTQPPWDNSAMDGYAVRLADVRTAPARLKVVEKVFAGHAPTRALGPMECARIMTGARLPEGAEAVVMQEHARALGEEEVEILEVPRPRQHIRDAGEDAKVGERLLAAGTPLGIPEAGLLWGQGVPRVPVHRRPTVAIVSTGDELCGPGEDLPEKIIDTNSPTLAALVRRAGGVPRLLGIAPDDLDAVVRRFEAGLSADVLVTCAGASVGEKDFAREALARLGVQVDFWKVAMKPGKPLAVGRRGRTLVFGLPGNPTSSLVTFELFVRPALRRLLGHFDPGPTFCTARLVGPFKKSKGLRHFVRVRADWRDGALWATPLASQTSGALASAAGATHLMSLPAETTEISAGSTVELLPVSWTA